MSKLDEIYNYVRRNGPTLPVEVASEVGVDSFLANAYLMQLTETNKLKSSRERVGGSVLYFLPGQESNATRRALQLVSQVKDSKTASKFQKSPVNITPELAQKREEFASRLENLEKAERITKQQKVEFLKQLANAVVDKKTEERKEFLSTMGERIKETLSKVVSPKELQSQPKIEEPVTTIQIAQPKDIELEAPKQAKSKRKRLFAPKVDLVSLASKYFENNNTEIISQEIQKKGKESEIIVNVPSNLGMFRMFVKVKSKGTINEADLSHVYTQGQNRKLPAMLITNGKLTKTAQNYLKVIGGLLKVKKLD